MNLLKELRAIHLFEWQFCGFKLIPWGHTHVEEVEHEAISCIVTRYFGWLFVQFKYQFMV